MMVTIAIKLIRTIICYGVLAYALINDEVGVKAFISICLVIIMYTIQDVYEALSAKIKQLSRY